MTSVCQNCVVREQGNISSAKRSDGNFRLLQISSGLSANNCQLVLSKMHFARPEEHLERKIGIHQNNVFFWSLSEKFRLVLSKLRCTIAGEQFEQNFTVEVFENFNYLGFLAKCFQLVLS